MELNLKRPIIFFDLETTGIDIARDRIVEISMVKVCLLYTSPSPRDCS